MKKLLERIVHKAHVGIAKRVAPLLSFDLDQIARESAQRSLPTWCPCNECFKWRMSNSAHIVSAALQHRDHTIRKALERLPVPPKAKTH